MCYTVEQEKEEKVEKREGWHCFWVWVIKGIYQYKINIKYISDQELVEEIFVLKELAGCSKALSYLKTWAEV